MFRLKSASRLNKISTFSGLLSKALLTNNLSLAVDLCLEQNRLADALILAMQGGAELWQEVQKK